MKKMRLFMLLALVLVCLSGIASAHTWDWVWSDDTTGCYYSRGSAVRLSYDRQAGETEHIKAWFEFRYEDENERQKMASHVQKFTDNDTSNLYTIVNQMEFVKKNGTVYYRFLNQKSYDFSRHCIHECEEPGPWEILAPNTHVEDMYERALADAR